MLLFAACSGAGLAVLTALGVLQDRGRAERLCWGFALGIGVIGWIMFFPAMAGALGTEILFGLCAVSAAGLVLLRRKGGASAPLPALDPTGWLLVGGTCVALAFDVIEGIAPPVDADTLSYHFALPKQFIEAGRLDFVPRAGTGATALLFHMTYLIAYGLGGETALTLWAMVSAWMAAALLFAFARRYLGFNWSLAAALLFLTTPAVLYGGGTGQVEVRLALFVLVAVYAASEALRTGEGRYAVLCGLAAGFYAGGKFMGLLFAAACGVAMLAGSGWFRRALLYGVPMLVAGSQWFIWNWVHTGDPTFPVLFSALGLPDSAIWDREHHAYYRALYFSTENPLPRDMLHFFAYPFIATFGAMEVLDAKRTGLGPWAMMVLPFALLGVYRFRRRLRHSPLLVPMVIVLLFYGMWFFSGTTQRIRHLLPFYPVLILCLTVAAVRWADRPALWRPLAAAAAVSILLHLGGQAVFAANYMKYFFAGESRETFYLRTVAQFDPVPWINANLTASDRILVTETQLIYPIQVPVYFAHISAQILVDLTARARDPERFLQQIRRQGITHILLPNRVDRKTRKILAPGKASMLPWLTGKLVAAGCAEVLATFDMKRIASRTMKLFNAPFKVETGAVVRVETEKCRL